MRGHRSTRATLLHAAACAAALAVFGPHAARADTPAAQPAPAADTAFDPSAPGSATGLAARGSGISATPLHATGGEQVAPKARVALESTSPASTDPMAEEPAAVDLGLGSSLMLFGRTLLVLLVVLGLVWLVLAKGLGSLVARSQKGNHIQVIERLNLDPKRMLVLIEVDDKRLLVGASDGTMQVLSDLSKKSFAGHLAERAPHASRDAADTGTHTGTGAADAPGAKEAT